MPLLSQNPTTEEILGTYPELTTVALEKKLAQAEGAFRTWRDTRVETRTRHLQTLARLLRERTAPYADLMTAEMGKPITQARAEVEKCAWLCEYYAAETERMLTPEKIHSDASESFVRFDPIGVILAIMPWNFPFWQVFRFIVPAAMAGNVGLLKHASNVSACGQAIEQVFLDAGFPLGIFQHLLVGSDKVRGIIEDRRVEAVTLTGSEHAGSQVAEAAGKAIKKTVLELGGSDPFIVLADADIDAATTVATKARFQNNGQSCIAAKRFIVVQEQAAAFIAAFQKKTEALVIGDPTLETTEIGPMVNKKALEEIDRQVQASITQGARLVTGGKQLERSGSFYAPTILCDVTPGMPAYDEELFGPVASVIIARDADDAIRIANHPHFGLGASLWTKNIPLAKELAARLEAGGVFINGLVKSDPRLPFGGIKRSGYGRELSGYGMKEFMNIKAVWIE